MSSYRRRRLHNVKGQPLLCHEATAQFYPLPARACIGTEYKNWNAAQLYNWNAAQFYQSTWWQDLPLLFSRTQ